MASGLLTTSIIHNECESLTFNHPSVHLLQSSMPPYPTRSYVRAHPSFQLDDGNDTQSPTKRSPDKRSLSRQSPYKRSPVKRSQRSPAPSRRPKVRVMTFSTLREGSVEPTQRTTDPTTPQTFNFPPDEELARAPKKLRRATNAVGGNDGSWLATNRGAREDISPLTSFAPGRLSVLPEVEVEDESVIQREYVRLMKGRETTKKVYEQWEQKEKENHTAAGPNMDVNQGTSSIRGIRRTDTEELFN